MQLALLITYVLELVLTGGMAALSMRVAAKAGSRTMSLLAISFLLLALSSALKIAWAILALATALALSSILMAASFLALAISHVYSVGSGPSKADLYLIYALGSPAFVAYTLAKGVSLYLVLYAAVETTIFYLETRYRESLLSAAGLYSIFASLLLGFTVVGISSPLTAEALQLLGYLLLASSGIYTLSAR